MTPPPPPATEPDRSTPGSRRRSGFVALGMVGTLALTLSGCSSSTRTPSRCVDPSTLKVLDAHSCSAGGSGAGQWYYCGYGTTTASGGTFSKSAAKRGGFGCPKGSSSGSGGG